MPVCKTPDYPYDDPPLYSDHQGSRRTEFSVKGPQYLEALSYLPQPPSGEVLSAFRSSARPVQALCRREQVLTAGAVPSVSCYALGLVGPDRLMIWSVDDRRFVLQLCPMLQEWALPCLEPVLELRPDIVRYRDIYASTALWSPRDWAELFAPAVLQVGTAAHAVGAKLRYFGDVRPMDRPEEFAAVGVDALSYLKPPSQGDADLREIKRRVGDRMCLWGGVSAPLTIEQGSADDVRRAVIEAIAAAAPGGGFILAPADAIMNPEVRENVSVFIQTCLQYGRCPLQLPSC